MVTDTKDKIVEYIKKTHQARAHDLAEYLNISTQATHRQLNKLISEGKLQKAGKPPLVFYILSSNENNINSHAVAQAKRDLPVLLTTVIRNNFLHITPDGKLLYGLEGFVLWASEYKKSTPIKTLAQEYSEVLNQKNAYTETEGWIDATQKLNITFSDNSIQKMLFEDIYSYPIFGRTKLAKLVMHAKQIENKDLITEISSIAKPTIEKIIKKFNIEAIAYIPPTVPRRLQFIDELDKKLAINLPKIVLSKVLAGDIAVPQKTLSTLQDRVINAKSTIFLRHISESNYKNVLLIDDVVGSGASFHETALKLKAQNIGSEKIIAYALVGNIKGYDVIRQL